MSETVQGMIGAYKGDGSKNGLFWRCVQEVTNM